MKIWNGLDRYEDRGPVAITIGNYDGVHLGHRTILRQVVERARKSGGTSALVTFEPHPLTIVAPERRPKRIYTRRQKLEALESTGLDGVLVLEFTRELSSLDGREFFLDFLGSRLTLDAVFVGADFRFGRDRGGDLALLRTIGADRGFDVTEVPAVELDGKVVSSSRIRNRIEEGDVVAAGRMLGKPFAVIGEVVRGDGRGRSLRFPTANLRTDNELLPARGVYVTETVVAASRYPSVTNVGVRPTFAGGETTVESHLIEFEGNLYGETAEVRFLARIREERKFDGPAELSDQIARDLAAAVAYFENAI